MQIIFIPLLSILLNAGALYILIRIVDGISYTGGWAFFVIAGVVLAILNLLVKPIIKLLALPFIFLTGGLFLIVLNAGLLFFLSYFLSVLDFRDISLVFENLSTYVIGAIVLGILNWLTDLIK